MKKSLEHLLKDLAKAVSAPAVFEQPLSDPDSGPIQVPVLLPLFPGVNECSGPSDTKESCKLCEELAAVVSSIGPISQDAVRARLISAAKTLEWMCSVLSGCSTSPSENKAPWGKGTSCMCKMMLDAIGAFKKIVSTALLTPNWSQSAISNFYHTMDELRATIRKSISVCFNTYSNEISQRKDLRQILNDKISTI